MSEKPSFFAELKRRNVYKVAVAYAVVAWLLMQVASQIFPFFEIPELDCPPCNSPPRHRLSDRADHRMGI